MAGWNLNPGAIKLVLDKVEPAATNLSAAVEKQDFTDISKAVTAGGNGLMGEVPAALNDLLAEQMSNLSNITNRIYAGMLGVTLANNAYVEGQAHIRSTIDAEAREADVQSHMLLTGRNGDFSWFKNQLPQAPARPSGAQKPR